MCEFKYICILLSIYGVRLAVVTVMVLHIILETCFFFVLGFVMACINAWDCLHVAADCFWG